MRRVLGVLAVSVFLAYGCGGGNQLPEKTGNETTTNESEQHQNVMVTGKLVLPQLNKPGESLPSPLFYAASAWSNATVQIIDVWGNTLATTSADINGTFSLSVPPGKNYFLRVVSGNLVLKSIIEDVSVDINGVLIGPNSSAVVKVLGVLLEMPNTGEPGIDISGALAGIDVSATISEIMLDSNIDGLVNALTQNILNTYNPNGDVNDSHDDDAGESIAQTIVSNITTVDTLAPSVFSVTPSQGRTEVDIFARVTVMFTEAIKAANLTPSTFRISAGSTGVSGSFSINGRNLEFTTSVPLSPFTLYTARISGTVTDHAGNPMGQDYTWSFTTGGNMEPLQSVQIGAGTSHSLLLKSNGTLWAWGRNFSGQANGGIDSFRPSPVNIQAGQVTPGTYWKEISVKGYHNFAIKTDGTLWAWGANDFGQLGNGSFKESALPVKIDGSNWKHISAGRYHVAGIKDDGTLWAWGNNSSGQFGDGSHKNKKAPSQVGKGNDWEQVALGSRYTVAIKTDGTLWTWGREVGTDQDGGDRVSPVQVGLEKTWLKIAASGTFSMALRMDGTLWAWGSNEKSQLGIGNSQSSVLPVRVGNGNDWKDFVTGGDWGDSQGRTIAIKTDGTLWAWGANDYGQLGNGTRQGSFVPTRIGLDSDWELPGAGDTHTVALKSDGTFWTWGDNRYSALGDGKISSKAEPVLMGVEKNWNKMDAGWGYTVATKTDQTLWAWGDNSSGQLGSGTSRKEQKPLNISQGTAWSQVSSGASHTAALKPDGSLWAWGLNDYGQLGDGTNTNRAFPTQVGMDMDWMEVFVGADYTVALKTDGTLWSWGGNNSGQLGNGNGIVERNSPLQVGAAIWAAIAVGDFHTAAIRNDGTLWTWGSNEYGQLGHGNEEDLHLPLQVGTGNNWVKVSAGDDYTVALRGDGTLWAWGENVFGQLGDGTNINRKTPAQVGVSVNWKNVSSGGGHTLAIRTDGTLWAWGNNDYGQLGDGSYVDRNAPVPVGTAVDWVRVVGGRYHSVGLRADGGLWVWGGNDYGQLGDGTAWRVTPKQLASF